MYDGTRPADGRASLADLCRLGATAPQVRREDMGDHGAPPTLPASTIEHLRLAAHRLREAECLVYRALNQNRLDQVPAAIAATKAALDQITAIR